VKQVPIGKLRVVTLTGLDLQLRPVPGAVYRTIGELNRGPNTLEISRTSTIEGDVLAAMLALDVQFGTQVTPQTTVAAIDTAVAGYLRALRAPDPALLDAGAIADAIYHGNGIAPAAQPTFLRKGATLVLRPTGWPPGMSAQATVDDPLSQPVVLDGSVQTLGPIAPGKWTLTVTPGPGLLPLQIPVIAAPGQTLQLPISFGTGTKLDDMPHPVGGALSAVIPLGTKPTFVTVGGCTSTADGGPEYLEGLSYTKDKAWVVGAVLDRAVVQAAGTSWENRLYWFGGLVGGAPTGEVQVFDPNNPIRPQTIAALPNGRQGWGLAGATIGDVMYLTGGTDGVKPVKSTLAFDPSSGTFGADALADLPTARIDLAGAVVDGKWYVFGGLLPVGQDLSAGVTDATNEGDVFTPGGAWKVLPPMPTARSGAAAVAVNGKIWVIGGATRFGAPTGAVEVYNPVAGSWSVRPPLQVPRAFPAVAFLDGKIVVAGGTLGPSPLEDVPSAAVEALTP
jgi:hypothetical protein